VADDRFVERDTGGDEDGEHDGEAGELLAAVGAQEEGDPERGGRECVAEVVDQVDEQRDRTAKGEDRDLCGRGEAEHCQADRDRPDASAGADNRAVDQPVRVSVFAVAPPEFVLVCLLWVVDQDASVMRSG
jgi:hypothetical protein